MWLLILFVSSQNPAIEPIRLEQEFLTFTECQEARDLMKPGAATIGNDVRLKCEYIEHEAQPI